MAKTPEDPRQALLRNTTIIETLAAQLESNLQSLIPLIDDLTKELAHAPTKP